MTIAISRQENTSETPVRNLLLCSGDDLEYREGTASGSVSVPWTSAERTAFPSTIANSIHKRYMPLSTVSALLHRKKVVVNGWCHGNIQLFIGQNP